LIMFEALKALHRKIIGQTGAALHHASEDPELIEVAKREHSLFDRLVDTEQAQATAAWQSVASGDYAATQVIGEEGGNPGIDPQRFTFINTLARKIIPDVTDAAVHKAQVAYEQLTEDSQTFIAPEGAVPGWRSFSILKQPGGRYPRKHAWRPSYMVVGVREDGLATAQRMSFAAGKHDDLVNGEPVHLARVLAASLERRDPQDPKIALDMMALDPDLYRSSEEVNLNHFSQAHKDLVDTAALKKAEVVRDVLMEDQPDTVLMRAKSGQLFAQTFGIMKNFEGKRIGAIRKHTLDHVDPEIRRIMFATHNTTTKSASLLAGAPPHSVFDAVDEEHGLRRRQAIQAFPVFANTLLARTKQIDAGASVKEILAKGFRSPPKLVDKLQGATWQMVGRHEALKPQALFQQLGGVDINHIPKSRKEWANLRLTREIVSDYRAACGDRRFEDELVSDMSGRFDIIAKTAADYAPGGIRDTVRFATYKLVAPAVAAGLVDRGLDGKKAEAIAGSREEEDYDVIGRRLTQDLMREHGLRKHVELCGRYHRNIRRYDSKIMKDLSDVTWAPMNASVDLGAGFQATEISSEEGLRRRGLEENHCVGGYTGDVLRGDCLIYILNKDEQSKSTVEIVPREAGSGKVRFEVHQNYGYGNCEPDKETLAAGKRLGKHLSTQPEKQWEDYRENLAAPRADYQASSAYGPVRRMAGFDYSDKSAMQDAWDELKPFLPKRQQKAGLEAFKVEMTQRALEMYVEVGGPEREELKASLEAPGARHTNQQER
jgi:hypothetical protein